STLINAAILKSDGSHDASFTAPTINSTVLSAAAQSDGKILIGGMFSDFYANGATSSIRQYGLAMLNGDGTLVAAFHPVFNNLVSDIQIQSDGKLLACGYFTQIANDLSSEYTTRYGLARLTADGKLDTTFTAEPDGYVSKIALQTDGKMIITGWFANIGSVSRARMARLNSDGTLDSAYNPPKMNDTVNTLLIQSDGSMVVTGSFTTLTPSGTTSPVSHPGLARITAAGDLDLSFGVMPAASQIGEVNVVTTTSTGSLLVGGLFSNLGGAPGSNLARFGPSGIVDSTFNPSPNGRVFSLLEMPMRSDATVFANRFVWLNSDLTPRLPASTLDFAKDEGRVYMVLPLADGSAIISGRFTINGPTKSISNLARIKADGTLDETFLPEPDAYVNTVKRQLDGKLVVSGGFTTIGGLTQSYIARLNPDGTADTTFKPKFNALVETLAIQSDGQILVGGQFTSYTAHDADSTVTSVSYLARLSSAGVLDANFKPTPDSRVLSIAIQSDDGKIVIGGSFTTLQPNSATTTTARKHIARLNTDGTLDTGFDPGLNGEVYSMAIQSDGKVVVGGGFTTIAPNAATTATTKYFLARLKTDGTLDTDFAVDPPNSYVNQVAIDDNNGSILVAGQFLQIGTESKRYVARLTSTGAIDATFKPDVNAPVWALGIASDHSILMGGSLTTADNDPAVLAGGAFTSIGNDARPYLALLSHNGQVMGTFTSAPNGAVNAMARHGDSGILVAGAFTSVSGTARSYIARLLLDGTLDASFKPDANGAINAMVVQPDGKALVAGAFTIIANTSRQGLARLNADGSIDPSFNPGVTGSVSALYVDESGKIVVGGSFTGIAGSSNRYLARLTSTGALDGSFNATTDGPVYSVAAVIGGQIFLGGSFTTVDGQARSNYARVDGNGNLVSDPASGANQAVRSLAVLMDGKVALGGSFTKFLGSPHYLIARHATGAFVRQSLGINAARDTLTWTRRAGNPLISNVRFEYSTDADNWTAIGGAPTVSSDSQTLTLTGFSALPASTQFFLKALAYVSANQNGSGSMHQTVWAVYITPINPPNTTDAVTIQGNVISIGGVAARQDLSFSSSDLPPGLSIDPSTGRIYGTPTALGTYLVHVNYADSYTSGSFTQSIQVVAGTGETQIQRLLAYSTRATSSTANPLIIGFIVKGDSPMPVVLRAIGPTLQNIDSSLTNAMAAPKGTLYHMTQQGSEMLFALQAWSDTSGNLVNTTARLGLYPLAVGSKDVSTLASLAPGAYTWVITGSDSSSGVVLAEVYDANVAGAG
ncbi:MAG: putative Ig domain-containing protein, partial [Opitutaceae bacterium]